MQTGTAMANLFAGRFDIASSWAEKEFRDLPSFLLTVAISAASYALAYRMDEAREAMATCAGSILRCESPLSMIGSRSGDWKTAPRSRMACEKQGCRHGSRMSALDTMRTCAMGRNAQSPFMGTRLGCASPVKQLGIDGAAPSG